MGISIQHVYKRFADFKALEDINFEIGAGELIALLGPSGSGKTTLLRIIAGIEFADEGELVYGTGITTKTPLKDRNIGFVFQHYALFRHMTVAENIGFSLKMKGEKKEIIKERVDELLKLVQLDGLHKRYPSELSGGQKQRVALARALASRPRVLLLDEPFGALDANVRKDLRKWLRNLHKEIKVTTIMVTHDQEEAFEVADRVVIMNKGRLEQIGKPDEVFHNPANPFVIKFLGNVNIFHGRIDSGKKEITSSSEISPNAKLYVRPHEWEVHLKNEKENSVEAVIDYINAASSVVKIDLTSNHGEELQVDIPYEKFKSLGIQKGDRVFLSPKEMKVFEDDFVI
ncbi:MAG: sulfate/molybdate ABC transporter ATP-binding protein [Leptospiraceae bacterium]|nr:sulfate/molybdate ABC transporter ATP-binding protein [Leptospiraceae bacterium]